MRATFAIALCLAFPVTAAEKIIDPPRIAKDARNSPPNVLLETFQRFEMLPIAMGMPWKGVGKNDNVLANLQHSFDQRICLVLNI